MKHNPASTSATLNARLSEALSARQLDEATAATVTALAIAAHKISDVLAKGPLAGSLGAGTGRGDQGGDVQKALDLLADDIVFDAVRTAPVGWYISEEQEQATLVDPAQRLLVAVDPLDGSSNIDVNVSVGTIFSILPCDAGSHAPSLLRPGSDQLAAGYFIYGPQTSLVLTYGHGVDIYVLDPQTTSFVLVESGVSVPSKSNEFAINASNYRHWQTPVRNIVDDYIAGVTGSIGRDHNMRWIASMIAEAHRILGRGGIYLYPGDGRAGYQSGRLRLIYEAAPIALIMEQAGAKATDGVHRILDKVPTSPHERTPLVFGSQDEVDRVTRYHAQSTPQRKIWPLFGARGLLRS